MDIVTDLTAEAVNYISVFQDICKEQLRPGTAPANDFKNLWEIDITEIERHNCSLANKQRIKEIIFLNKARQSSSDEETHKSVEVFFSIIKELLHWIQEKTPLIDKTSNGHGTINFTPYQWRNYLREILYDKPNERIVLAEILHYMPIQIILCLGGRFLDAYKQRVCQVWEPSADIDLVLLSGWEEAYNFKWWNSEFIGEIRLSQVAELLGNDSKMLSELKRQGNPVPFESFFNAELEEIANSRQRRLIDRQNVSELTQSETIEPLPQNNDPLKRAKSMKLIGVAFSGGGIRSATFNLGILQKLAEDGILSRTDYISTVSGGGYIGSWLTSWIKRAGSVTKVADRLNMEKSADPMAEEVLPIRWLRMYSNYLNPDASIMSLDSWTVGITWLRNTLINQIVLLMILCSFLAFTDLLFTFWKYQKVIIGESSNSNIIWWSSGLLILGCLIAGLGMRMYDETQSRWQIFNLGKYKFLSWVLMIWAFVTSYVISNWLYLNFLDNYDFDFTSISLKLSIFSCILIIACLGNYHKYAIGKWSRYLIYPLILISSYLASVACVYMMEGAKILLVYISNNDYILRYFAGNKLEKPLSEISFVFLIPIILEIISLTVIIRMVLMGNMFPDERREWWGRMGANIHRFILCWIVITGSILILPTRLSIQNILSLEDPILELAGGWAAVIGLAVKLAFNSGSTKPAKKDGLSAKEVFIRFAPYLFFIGILLIGSSIYQLVKEHFTNNVFKDRPIWTCVGVSFSFLFITLLISWRVGVNEFSLHHFYRNRLTRAYLGATRRRTSRIKTANNFTGFDRLDDIKLATLRVKYDYYGPYPLLNCTLNASTVSDLDRQDRKAESFVFSPLFSGFDISPTRSSSYSENRVYDYGYRPTVLYAYDEGPSLGAAMAISGAAVNPNQGHHSSSATAFLLTIFNVRLGWWIGNPRLSTWQKSDPPFGLGYVIKDLIGKSDINSDYVCLSDGGHFDNMGLYELIRRRCAYIILGDAEQDTDTTFEGLANAIRRCWIDFGVKIEIDGEIVHHCADQDKLSQSHVIEYKISYPSDPQPTGRLIYIKTKLTGDEPTDIREYKMKNSQFPQESTGDQFFDESQFESYRKLGYHSLEGYKFNLPK